MVRGCKPPWRDCWFLYPTTQHILGLVGSILKPLQQSWSVRLLGLIGIISSKYYTAHVKTAGHLNICVIYLCLWHFWGILLLSCCSSRCYLSGNFVANENILWLPSLYTQLWAGRRFVLVTIGFGGLLYWYLWILDLLQWLDWWGLRYLHLWILYLFWW